MVIGDAAGDALMTGAIIAALAGLVALFLAWRIAAAMPRLRRVGLAAAASYGGVALVAGLASIHERADLVDELLVSALVIGGFVLLIAAPILFFLSPRP